MNFVLVENNEGKEAFVWDNNIENLPTDIMAFTYYQQDIINENGLIQSSEYRIGAPVKFIIGDMYIHLEPTTLNSQKDDIYCLYIENGKRKFKPINSNTTLVNNFSELEQAFVAVTKKEQIAKNK